MSYKIENFATSTTIWSGCKNGAARGVILDKILKRFTLPMLKLQPLSVHLDISYRVSLWGIFVEQADGHFIAFVTVKSHPIRRIASWTWWWSHPSVLILYSLEEKRNHLPKVKNLKTDKILRQSFRIQTSMVTPSARKETTAERKYCKMKKIFIQNITQLSSWIQLLPSYQLLSGSTKRS